MITIGDKVMEVDGSFAEVLNVCNGRAQLALLKDGSHEVVDMEELKKVKFLPGDRVRYVGPVAREALTGAVLGVYPAGALAPEIVSVKFSNSALWEILAEHLQREEGKSNETDDKRTD